MPTLYDGDYIRDDLDALRRNPATARHADMLDAFLSEVAGSEEALWELKEWSVERTFPDPIFNVKALVELQNEGYNLYRLRPLRALRGYRVIYAYDPAANDSFYALAIVRKAPPGAEMTDDYYNYERNHPITERVIKEYDDLRIPRTR